MFRHTGYNGRRQLPFIIFTFIFLFTFFLDRTIQEGMFFDGLTYASVSRNMAFGKGSIWQPYYRHPGIFAEQPPLMFWLQAMFFKVFGDHYYTEKIYSLFTFILTILLFTRLWKKIDADKDFRDSYWFPLLLWASIPIVMWTYSNNMEESTMAIFDLAAVLLLFPGAKGRSSTPHLVLAGLMIFCATFTKGPVGAFPLAVPLLLSVVYGKKFITSLLQAMVLLFIVAGIYLLLWQYRQSRELLQAFLDRQLLAALEGKRDVTSSSLGHFRIFIDLVYQLAPALVISLVIWLFGKRTRFSSNAQSEYRRHIVFFALLAFAASAPIAISLKQRSYYLVPSFPYFSVVLALVALPYLHRLLYRHTLSQKAMLYIKYSYFAIAAICLILVGTKFGTIGRDREIIEDVKLLSRHIPRNEQVGICKSILLQYDLVAYLERYHEVEVIQEYWERNLLLVDAKSCPAFADTVVNDGYTLVKSGMRRLKLYSK